MKEYIDMQSWPRKKLYEMFIKMDYPHFNVCANVDITIFKNFIKQKDLQFYKTMVFLSSIAVNSIPEFNYRIESVDKVVKYDFTHPSFTVLTKSELFSFCSVDYSDDYNIFSNRVDDQKKIVEKGIDMNDTWDQNNLIYITTLPWISFTSITHPVSLSKTDSVPRISWGKFYEENGKIKLPFSVQVNHSLLDGFHMGKYYTLLQEILDNPGDRI